MSVLVDTSVWVVHYRRRDEVLTHPLVVGELACGTPPAPREQTLRDIERLRSAQQATWPEIRALIERERVWGQGCGLVDVALLASVMMTPGAGLWTLDRRLEGLAERFHVAHAATE